MEQYEVKKAIGTLEIIKKCGIMIPYLEKRSLDKVNDVFKDTVKKLFVKTYSGREGDSEIFRNKLFSTACRFERKDFPEYEYNFGDVLEIKYKNRGIEEVAKLNYYSVKEEGVENFLNISILNQFVSYTASVYSQFNNIVKIVPVKDFEDPNHVVLVCPIALYYIKSRGEVYFAPDINYLSNQEDFDKINNHLDYLYNQSDIIAKNNKKIKDIWKICGTGMIELPVMDKNDRNEFVLRKFYIEHGNVKSFEDVIKLDLNNPDNIPKYEQITDEFDKFQEKYNDLMRLFFANVK
jgi:hypothetical protein